MADVTQITLEGVTYNIKDPVARAGASTSDISNMTVNQATTVTANYPVPAAGETCKSILGKVRKFFRDVYSNAITGLSVSGRTITYTKANGTTGTITTQDSDHTYSLATTSSDGLLRKLNGASNHYMDGTGNWVSGYLAHNSNLKIAFNGTTFEVHYRRFGTGRIIVGHTPAMTIYMTTESTTYPGWYYAKGTIDLSNVSNNFTAISSVQITPQRAGGFILPVALDTVSKNSITFYVYTPKSMYLSDMVFHLFIEGYQS